MTEGEIKRGCMTADQKRAAQERAAQRRAAKERSNVFGAIAEALLDGVAHLDSPEGQKVIKDNLDRQKGSRPRSARFSKKGQTASPH